jgi:hypothetical protein
LIHINPGGPADSHIGGMNRPWITLDGNEAAARVAYQLSEVIG